jgi:hypothetical protein
MKAGAYGPVTSYGLPTVDTAELFDLFAQESMPIAEQADEPREREMFLRLALMWAAAAQRSTGDASYLSMIDAAKKEG